jgi:hypothetical protein
VEWIQADQNTLYPISLSYFDFGVNWAELLPEIIKEKLHNAIVIAISKATPVLDQSATMFAEEFYDLILQGFTPDRAFKLAKSAVRGNACCC